MKRLLPLALVFLSTGAFANLPDVFRLDSTQSSLSYKIVHKFHESEGKTRKVEGAAAMKPKRVLVQVRATVSSFDSGNSNRDAHMQEVLEANKFPDVTLKGELEGFVPPTKFPATVGATLKAEITMHGQTQKVAVPVNLEFSSAQSAHAKANFSVSLDGFKVERPSLMFVKIEDACQISADLYFASAASASNGS